MSIRDFKITSTYYADKPEQVKEMLFDYGEGVCTHIVSPDLTQEENSKRKEECSRIALKVWEKLQKRIIAGLEERGLTPDDVVLDLEEDKSHIRVYESISGQKGKYLFSHRDVELKQRGSETITNKT